MIQTDELDEKCNHDMTATAEYATLTLSIVRDDGLRATTKAYIPTAQLDAAAQTVPDLITAARTMPA